MTFEQPKIKENKSKEKEGKIICAWCGKEMGTKKGVDGTTHSMCEECLKKETKKLDKNK